MKKRIIAAVLAIMMLMSVTVIAGEDTVTATEAIDRNLLFSNGYVGFCIDQEQLGSKTGQEFTFTNNTSLALNNKDNTAISQKLKILFTLNFEELFVSDGNGGYIIDEIKPIHMFKQQFGIFLITSMCGVML